MIVRSIIFLFSDLILRKTPAYYVVYWVIDVNISKTNHINIYNQIMTYN